MKRKIVKNQTNTRGITLIALIITVIVLLILAGITIATLTGENGILKKAIKAKQNSTIENYKEEIKLEIIDEQAQRKLQESKAVFIVTLKERLENKDWIKEIIMCDDNFEVQEDKTKNTKIIVNTVDNYQITIDIDNDKILATIKEGIDLDVEVITIKYNAKM